MLVDGADKRLEFGVRRCFSGMVEKMGADEGCGSDVSWMHQV
jgi:hypothetical protein